MDTAADSRDAIKTVALDLLIAHGYRGMSFADIASSLGVTRANVHYHFGSKANLIDEVLTDYVRATLLLLEEIWTASDTSFRDKLAQTLRYSRTRYRTFNGTHGNPKTSKPWSLISRLRQDEDMLAPSGRAQLRQFTAKLHAMFSQAAQRAFGAGELRQGVSPAATAILLVVVVDNATPITMTDGGFGALEAAYDALESLIL